MKYIDLVIKLPEADYKVIVEKYDTFPRKMKEWGLSAIKYGIPLPKGHGKIIDADKIGLTDLEILMCDGNYKEALKMLIDKINKASPIIEADKVESEEEK